MTATLAGSGQQRAVPGEGGRIVVGIDDSPGDVLVVGTTPRGGLKRAVHGSVSAYCSSHLPGQVSVVAAGSPSQGRGELDPVGTWASQPGRVTRLVRR